MTLLNSILSYFSELLTWFTVVNAWESRIRVRLGKHIKPIGPGLHIRLPYVDQMYVVSDRVSTLQIPVQNLSSVDGQFFCVRCLVQYRIVDVHKMFLSVNGLESMVSAEVTEVISNCVTLKHSEGITAEGLGQKVNEHLTQLDWGVSIVTGKP